MTETVSKLLGYSLEGSIDGAASARKLLGYALEGTIGGGPKVAKLLGYALLSTLPAASRPQVSNSVRIGPRRSVAP